ncbi:hypothetical protein HN51_055348, partial [Arachis hypogaea]
SLIFNLLAFCRNNIHIPKPRHVAWVLEVFRELCKTKFLWLQLSTIEWLISAPVLDLPDFCNLIQL